MRGLICILTWSSTPLSTHLSTDSLSFQGFIRSFASSGTVRLRPKTLSRSITENRVDVSAGLELTSKSAELVADDSGLDMRETVITDER